MTPTLIWCSHIPVHTYVHTHILLKIIIDMYVCGCLHTHHDECMEVRRQLRGINPPHLYVDELQLPSLRC